MSTHVANFDELAKMSVSRFIEQMAKTSAPPPALPSLQQSTAPSLGEGSEVNRVKRCSRHRPSGAKGQFRTRALHSNCPPKL